MADVKAGSVYTEVRIELGKLQGDIQKASRMFEEMGAKSGKGIATKLQGGFADIQKQVSAVFKNVSNTGMGQFAKLAQGIGAVFKDLPIGKTITDTIAKVVPQGDGDFLNKISEGFTKITGGDFNQIKQTAVDMGGEYANLVNNVEGYYKELEKKEAVDTFQKNTQAAFGNINQLFSAVSGAVLASMQQETGNYISELEKRNEALQESLDEELQQRLFAAGLSDAQTQEQHEIELQNAIATGNQKLIYEKEQAAKRYAIEKDIADRKKALDDAMNEEKKQKEYELATTQWRMQLAQAFIAAAQAQLSIWAGVPKVDFGVSTFVLAGIAAGISGAQIAAIQAQKPQKFAEGGIVPGYSFSGDNILTRQNSGEMDLNMRQQKNLFNAIDEGNLGGKVTQITCVIELDGNVLAERVFEAGSSGNSFIRARGVVN